MKLTKILDKLNNIAPLEYAEPWDNVGLLAGDLNSNINNIMLTIDLTRDVLDQAKANKTNLIIAYHPPIFEPIKKVVSNQGPSPLLYEAIRSNIAIYSPHTALDVAPGGVNDALANMLNLQNTLPLAPKEIQASPMCKIVTFIPENNFADVSQAMFNAGAGDIGSQSNYSKCSFRSKGTGTFFCGPNSTPAIGTPNTFAQTEEYKFESIVPSKAIKPVIAALLKSHPYQEVAYDIIPLLQHQNLGLGRIGTLEKPTKVSDLITHIKKSLKLKTVGIIAPTKNKIQKIAVAAGSCGSLLQNVINNNCDFFLTGELKHHDALKLQAANITTVCLSHSNSERLILKQVASQLRKFNNKLTVTTSSKDRDPFTWC